MEVCPCDIHDILEQSIKHNDAISAEGYAKYIASIRPTARLRLLEKWWEEAQIKNDKLGELNADILAEMKYQTEDEKIYFFEPLEKEISVEDMQKIVDANEKLVKDLKYAKD